MKKALPYILMFALSTGGAAALVGVLYVTQPRLFRGQDMPPDSTARTRVDTVAGVASARAIQIVDSTSHAAPTLDAPSHARQESVDSVNVLREALGEERSKSAVLAEQLRTSMDSTLKVAAAADSVQGEQRRAMAKVLEAMDPESAARILRDFPDGDVKQIILTIKKRQAAKILAALEPDRAARIMR